MKYLLLVVLALGFGLGAHEPKAVRISKIEVKSAVTAQLSPDRSDLVIFANDDFVALETQFKSKRSFNDAVQTKNPIVGELHQRIEKLKKEVAAGSAVGASRTVAFKIASQNEIGEFTREMDLTIVSTKTSPILLSVQVTVAGPLKPAESLLNAIKSVADESTVLENHGSKLFGAAALTWFYFWKTQNYPAPAVRAYDWVFADKPLRGMAYDKDTVTRGIRSALPDNHKELEMLFWDDVKSGEELEKFYSTRGAYSESVYDGFLVMRLTTLIDAWRLAGKHLLRNKNGGFTDLKCYLDGFFTHIVDNPFLLDEEETLEIKNASNVLINFKKFCELLTGRRRDKRYYPSAGRIHLVIIDDLGADYSEKGSRRISSRYWGKDPGVFHKPLCFLNYLGIDRCRHSPYSTKDVKAQALFGEYSIFGKEICPQVVNTEGNGVDSRHY